MPQNRTFRLTGPPAQNEATLRLLADQGFVFAAHGFYPDAFELVSGPLPLGSSLAARFGLIYIQDASSMLPPLALLHLLRNDEGEEEKNKQRSQTEINQRFPKRINVLDMCSSPGGKSSLLARELERYWPGRGFVLANEPGVKRLATLRRNLRDMNLFNCGSSGFEGQNLPLPAVDTAQTFASYVLHADPGGLGDQSGAPFPGWDCIILDPPCSGWGTVEKNPQVMKLWQGDKVRPLIGLQRLLLTEALRLLRPGGLLVYSTCTVNVQENEEQVLWAMHTLGNCSALPLPPFAGFSFADPLLDLDGCLRVPLGSALGQGFFIAALRKDPRPSENPHLSFDPEAYALEESRRENLRERQMAGQKERRNKDRSGQADAVELPLSSIQSPLCSPDRLPPGRLFCQRDNLVFYPQGGLDLLGLPGTGTARNRDAGNFAWNGFALGRSPGAGLKPRTDTDLRGLMPDPASAAQAGAAVLNLEETAPILALLSGQSLNLGGQDCAGGSNKSNSSGGAGKSSSGAAEAGLYYRDLPLCRLKTRGGRVFI